MSDGTTEAISDEASASADETCDSSCSSCGVDCDSRKEAQDFKAKPHAQSNIKHIIAVVSGKGGVGKTLVTSLLASALRKKGLKVGILDADITGPSIPKAFGIDDKLRATAQGMLPSVSKGGIQIVSTNLILPEETTPVLWRGAIISGLVKQFFSEVIWGDLDYLLIDMPPGTGDVPLTVYQSLPIDGIVIVTAPQDLVSMIVGKAINMADMMNIPVLGLVENMSFFECPDCHARHDIFGAGKLDEIAADHQIDLVARIPIVSDIAAVMDAGDVESVDNEALNDFVKALGLKVEELTAVA